MNKTTQYMGLFGSLLLFVFFVTMMFKGEVDEVVLKEPVLTQALLETAKLHAFSADIKDAVSIAIDPTGAYQWDKKTLSMARLVEAEILKESVLKYPVSFYTDVDLNTGSERVLFSLVLTKSEVMTEVCRRLNDEKTKSMSCVDGVFIWG